MPKNPQIHKVLVIGSGPIVIGQAAEFDYAGTQACRALREEGLEVVLVNSNPATIMTDTAMADEIYMEPLKLETLERIILEAQPDSLLPTLGGQTGLTLAMQLAKSGFLKEHNVRLLGANPETIDKAEDRQMFKDTMLSINQPCVPSKVVTTTKDALDYAKEIGYPVIVRPAFTLGGTGGGIANDEAELDEIATGGLRLSPITQVLIEKCIAGWKEIEFEVMRDSKGDAIAICSMENFDPVGVHTGDSIVIAPCVTLADKEYQMLRSAALNIIHALGVEGGCNVQFALKPDSFEYAVIEVNPRVSRSSALASKATGYPIAKVAAKIAIGYTLDELRNAITHKTSALFEPALDYVAVKFPKWPFDKFVYAKRTLGTQMKATGEVMALGSRFEEALMKAVRGAEISQNTLRMKKLAPLTDEEIVEKLHECTDERVFCVYEALCRGISPDVIHEITMIDKWFLGKLMRLVEMERELSEHAVDNDLYMRAKRLGFLDRTIEELSGQKLQKKLPAGYSMVDTCAAEFAAQTPYFYATYDGANEASDFIRSHPTDKRTVIVLGSGPIRIGQGIEFDYASVHCVWALKRAGFETVIINNNPETVSTDFDTADRLYFEPLTPEDVMNVIKTENPYGVVVAFGGGTAIKLTKFLESQGVRILGTSADSIDRAEDRERFDELLEELNIKRPKGAGVMTEEEAIAEAHRLDYPVLLRPSYVLGGQNMIIAFSDEDVHEYMKIILSHKQDNPVLIDKYLMGIEVEVDAISDGKDILIPGIMEHIERAGIHSGDSIAVYPPRSLNGDITDRIVENSRQLALALDTHGLINIQYVIYEHEIYVIEVNPRSSRTVPYLSKVTGVPMVDLATRCMLGENLRDMGYGCGLYKAPPYVAVKVPVFSFEKLMDLDTQLGPEMKSTGEVLGVGKSLEEALFKGLTAAGYNMQKHGGVFISVRDTDKFEIPDIARKYAELGFELYATEGTARVLAEAGIKSQVIGKIHESSFNAMTLLDSGKVQYVISTSAKGRLPNRDSVKIRRKAVERAIPCLTSLDTAVALANSLRSRYSLISTELVDIGHLRTEKTRLSFTKMQGCGNDYIYFDGFRENIISPESLAVLLSDRHFGIGGDGVVTMLPSRVADAKMRMFNLDGSEGMMCGNAIRCMAKYLYESGIVHKTEMDIETRSGIKHIKLFLPAGNVTAARVDMGPAILDSEKVPTTLKGDPVIDAPVTVAGHEFKVTCLSMGNPHCVIFVPQVNAVELDKIGPLLEYNDIFPERANIEFVTVVSRTHIKMRVWERGSGETWACGTGACAAAVASVLHGFCPKDEDIRVDVKGGRLDVKYTDETVYLTGDCEKIYDGVVEI